MNIPNVCYSQKSNQVITKSKPRARVTTKNKR